MRTHQYSYTNLEKKNIYKFIELSIQQATNNLYNKSTEPLPFIHTYIDISVHTIMSHMQCLQYTNNSYCRQFNCCQHTEARKKKIKRKKKIEIKRTFANKINSNRLKLIWFLAVLSVNIRESVYPLNHNHVCIYN